MKKQTYNVPMVKFISMANCDFICASSETGGNTVSTGGLVEDPTDIVF